MSERERIALVTGAGRGIGKAIAQQLAADGCAVVVTARTSSELDDVVTSIVDAGGRALAIVADLTDRTEPARIVQRVSDEWGAVNVLVNNAGVGSSQGPQPLVDFDEAFWDLTFEVNVHAPFLLTKSCLPAMISAGWGRIINISSINAKVPAFHGAAYTASKHAVAGLTKATANEVASLGVTANAVCPGVTATLLNDMRVEYDARRLGKSFEDIEAEASPLGRRLLPEEISGLAVFLAGESAGAINGQLINVCGGRLMA